MTDAPFIRPDMKAFLDMMAQVNGPTLAQMTLPEARASYQAMHNLADRPARDLAVIRDLACPGPNGDIPLRLYDARESRDKLHAFRFPQRWHLSLRNCTRSPVTLKISTYLIELITYPLHMAEEFI